MDGEDFQLNPIAQDESLSESSSNLCALPQYKFSNVTSLFQPLAPLNSEHKNCPSPYPELPLVPPYQAPPNISHSFGAGICLDQIAVANSFKRKRPDEFASSCSFPNIPQVSLNKVLTQINIFILYIFIYTYIHKHISVCV